jgi:hypothetical protein
VLTLPASEGNRIAKPVMLNKATKRALPQAARFICLSKLADKLRKRRFSLAYDARTFVKVLVRAAIRFIMTPIYCRLSKTLFP